MNIQQYSLNSNTANWSVPINQRKLSNIKFNNNGKAIYRV